ncbi:type I-U CRISPR-associated protein Csb2 [Reyranella sp.]|uniref:type I-G CRISPR-associated protein Csb2 n=1 Tax=Reyranella sp. TaxID=1929291 RepID=UPI0025DEBC39|nr:type I-U CRISPR-associated protein Csb2 [Reyranella sp.]
MDVGRHLFGTHLLPDCLHGSPAGGADHPHAFYLPEDADGDGHMDHFLVYAGGGLDAHALTLCAGLSAVSLGRRRLKLSTMRIGGLVDRVGGPFGPAREWVSRTPYVTPNRALRRGRVRPGYDVETQIVDELKRRGLPQPQAIEIFPSIRISEEDTPPEAFVPPQRGSRALLADRIGCFVRLAFRHPQSGPLALGHACHFGLGHFGPAGTRRGMPA